MSFVKCFDAVSMVIDEASKQFGRTWKENEEYKQCLKSSCNAVDLVVQQSDGVSFDVDINDITMDITVSLVCGIMIAEDMRSPFYDAIRYAKKFSVHHKTDDEIQVDFVFPGIWERA